MPNLTTLFAAAPTLIVSPGGLPQSSADDMHLQTILSVVFTIIGALALVMLVVSGLRYVLSAGDPQKAAKARSGIITALAGVVVAIAAQAIVVFVVRRV